MYELRSLPVNATSALDPRNKPLPTKPSPSPSAFPAASDLSRRRHMVPRTLPTKEIPNNDRKRQQRRQQHQQQKQQQEQPEEESLFTAFPIPRSRFHPTGYITSSTTINASSASSGDESVSSSTFSLPLSPTYAYTTTVEPLRLGRASPATDVQDDQQPPKMDNDDAHRPRPDSIILPPSSSPPLVRPSQLDGRYFARLVRQGDVLHYWLSVDLVLQGVPGKAYVPRGHWDRLVRLAEDVRLSGEAVLGGNRMAQFVTGWCRIDDPLGDVIGFHSGVTVS